MAAHQIYHGIYQIGDVFDEIVCVMLDETVYVMLDEIRVYWHGDPNRIRNGLHTLDVL